MVRRARILAVAALLALCACKKREPAPSAMVGIVASEPNQRARALRVEMERLATQGKLDEAAARSGAVAKAVGDILTAMDALHHQKTAVPDFEVVRYVEALRDLGSNLRGFERLYSPKNPEALKREMVQGLIEQIKSKIR